MCGIFGFATTAGKHVRGSTLDRCTGLLAHRGPDGAGQIGWDGRGTRYEGPCGDQPLVLGLGHRRLAIFDLSAAGRQPMRGPRGEWVVYNGEIYNFPEIRRELAERGYVFRTGTDTEVLLAAYAEWGTDCVDRFNGMWAFALYDPARRGLFCCRDRLGIKPLYYVSGDDLFCFASELPPIFECLGGTPAIDAEELARYIVFRTSDDGPCTMYAGVSELRGGHSAWLDLVSGKLSVRRYWSLPEGPDIEAGDEEALDRFSELLEDSVRLRLRADVPVAVTLSGGTDSSAVALAASRVGTGEIVTFTSSFRDHPEIDETRYAQEVAKRCGVRSVLVEPDLGRLVEEEPLLTCHQALPYGSLSLYVHWAILKRIREQGIPVVLSGQGGDESFLGYELYYVAQVLSLWPNVPRMLVAGWQGGRRSRLGLTQMAAHLAFFGNPWLRRSVLLRRARSVFRPEIVQGIPARCESLPTDLRKLQAGELLGSTLGRLLRYDDRTSAAHGMETRLPLLDYRLVEYAYRLPWKHKIRQGWTKYLVRRYLDRHLPESVAWRRCKLGFNAPTGQWAAELLRRRGERLFDHPIRKCLLSDRAGPSRLPARQRWTVYNLLHLAVLLNWSSLTG